MLTAEQLAAARRGAAVGPVLEAGFLRLAGPDARSFLHRMCTQDLSRLSPGQAAYTALLTARGHLVAEGYVLAEEGGGGDTGGLLLCVDPAALAAAHDHLAHYVVMDDVQLEPCAGALRVLPVLGPEAEARLAGRGGGRRMPTARRGVPALELWASPGEVASLAAALAAEGVPALDAEALEALRVLGGQPRFGPDLGAARLPMEAGLTGAAISFTKGCYLGQEIVVRATARGQLQRGLVQVALPPGAGPGTPLRAGEAEVGVVTSAAETPEGRLGLAYLRRAHWRTGERLGAGGGEAEVRRVLVEEP